MSTDNTNPVNPQDDEKPEPETGAIATQRKPQPGHGPFGGGMPAEKSKNFGPSAKRLVGRLRPEALNIAWVFILSIASVVFTVLGPKILGQGTTLIFEGVISKSL